MKAQDFKLHATITINNNSGIEVMMCPKLTCVHIRFTNFRKPNEVITQHNLFKDHNGDLYFIHCKRYYLKDAMVG